MELSTPKTGRRGLRLGFALLALVLLAGGPYSPPVRLALAAEATVDHNGSIGGIGDDGNTTLHPAASF